MIHIFPGMVFDVSVLFRKATMRENQGKLGDSSTIYTYSLMMYLHRCAESTAGVWQGTDGHTFFPVLMRKVGFTVLRGEACDIFLNNTM